MESYSQFTLRSVYIVHTFFMKLCVLQPISETGSNVARWLWRRSLASALPRPVSGW